MRKFTSIILSAILVLSGFCVLGGISASALTSGDYEYSISDGTTTITKYTGSATNVKIPSSIGGYSVTGIGHSAFFGCTSLTNITIPNSVVDICKDAFGRCTSLTNITIPNSVTSIDIRAFDGCTNLTNVIIGNGVKKIGDSAFSYCTSLIKLTIGNSVSNMGAFVFCGCSSLTNITICNGVTNIGYGAFSDCKGIESITIPSSVKNIGDMAFMGCENLKSIAIPDGITKIGKSCFCDCKRLQSITIPESVISIEDAAFGNCYGISVIYKGSREQWRKITIGVDNKYLTSAVIYYEESSVTEITDPTQESATGITYTIKYKLCGGTGNIPDQIKIKGVDLKISNTLPTHTKYSFAYWLSSNGETKYDRGSLYKIDADDTLYAVWRETCSVCKGTQYSSITTCSKCKGKGKITYTTPGCSYCNSTGVKTKTHTETCSNCKGEGIYYGYGLGLDGYFGWQYLPCPLCNATGKIKTEEQVICNICGGDGKAEKEISCSNCEGNGEFKTICEKCEGKGKIYHYPSFNTIDVTESLTTEPISTETPAIEPINEPIVEPTTKQTILEPTQENMTIEPKTEPYSIDPTEVKPSVEPTTEPFTVAPVSEPVTDKPSEPIEPTSANNWVVMKPPTCDENGIESNCFTLDIREIPSLGHKTIIVSKKAATYFTKGYSGKKVCTVCHKVISKGEETAMLKLGVPKIKITAGKKKISVKCTKVKDATGFQVRYIFKGKTVNKIFTANKSVTKTIKKLKKGKYTVKVRALIKSNGKMAYSNWTKTKRVKVKNK